MIAVAVLLLLVGVLLGVLGGGGSILAVPALTWGAGLSTREAIATSLVVVGVTSLWSLVGYARKGMVEWRTGSVFAVTAMVGAWGGGSLASHVPEQLLMLLFAAMMVMTALAMLAARQAAPKDAGRAPVWQIIGEGMLVGAFTGLVGAGGGFLVVPALVLLGGMEMQRAVATSLLVIGLKSFAAVAGHMSTGGVIDLRVAVLATGMAIVGSVLGTRVARHLPARALRCGFAFFVLAMALLVVGQEAGLVAAGVLAVVMVVSVAGIGWWSRQQGRGCFLSATHKLADGEGCTP